HCIKEETKEKWKEILALYDQLLLVNYSPSVALKRVFALYKAQDWQAALVASEKLKLESNHFYFVLLGELYKNVDKYAARLNFRKAYALAKTQSERRDIQAKIDNID